VALVAHSLWDTNGLLRWRDRRERLERTLRFLHAVNPRNACWSPPGLHNTILQHVGHAYILAEWLTMRALGREPRFPTDGSGCSGGRADPPTAGRHCRKSGRVPHEHDVFRGYVSRVGSSYFGLNFDTLSKNCSPLILAPQVVGIFTSRLTSS
jgi:hypothetical protein